MEKRSSLPWCFSPSVDPRSVDDGDWLQAKFYGQGSGGDSFWLSGHAAPRLELLESTHVMTTESLHKAWWWPFPLGRRSCECSQECLPTFPLPSSLVLFANATTRFAATVGEAATEPPSPPPSPLVGTRRPSEVHL